MAETQKVTKHAKFFKPDFWPKFTYFQKYY